MHHTPENSTCGAKSIERITMVKVFISDHVIVIFILGKSFYEFVASLKLCFMPSKLTDGTLIVACWK